MEIAGLAIGAVGLLALVDSCNKLMGRIDSFRHAGSEAKPILAEFAASRYLFDRWQQNVKIGENSIEMISGEKVNDQKAQVVRDLITSIMISLQSIEAVITDFIPSAADVDRNGGRPAMKKRSTRSSAKAKFQWAFSKKQKAVRGVQELCRLLERLHAVIPMNEPTAINPCSAQNLSEKLLEKQLERDKAEDRRIIHQWLGAKSTESYYEDRLHDCQDGTCSWIFVRPELISWSSSEFPDDAAKILWLHAPAGFGKTILCAQIVDSLRRTAPRTTALYFFSGHENDTYGIFRSWISQIIYQDDAALQIVASNPRTRMAPSATHSDLEQTFRSLVQSDSSFTFVVDGLDECEDKAEFSADFTTTNRYKFVKTLLQMISGTRTRIMIASRPIADVRSSIYPDKDEVGLSVFEIPISVSDVDDDLKAFSKATVDGKLSSHPEESRAKLADQMAERAGGMFLWVKLHQSGLRRSKNQNQLRGIIDSMPEGLNRTYDKNMEKIRKLDSVDRARVFFILRWILMQVDPPTIEDIAIGFAVQRSTITDFQYDELPAIVDQNYIDEEITSPCAGFIEVCAESKSRPPKLQTVRLVHSSVRDYLLRLCPEDSPGTPFSDTVLQGSRLCEIFLRFLNYECAWEPPSFLATELNLWSFTDCSASFWLSYFPRTGNLSTEIRELIHHLFSPINVKWERWRAFYEDGLIVMGELWHHDWIGFQWPTFMEMLKSTGEEMIGKCQRSLKTPDADEFDRMLDNMLEQRMDYSELQDIAESMMPLLQSETYQMMNGSEEISTAFAYQLDKISVFKPECNIASNFHSPGTRVYYGVHTGNVEIARSMIEMEPESIDTPGGLHGSALQLACWLVLPDIVRELIDRGADVNIQSGTYGCALNAAVAAENRQIIQIILDAGANLNVRDSQGRDALFYALLGSDEHIATQLLQCGAETKGRYQLSNFSETPYMTALHLAVSTEQIEPFKLLLEKGADASACTENKHTCLHTAASRGLVKFVDEIINKVGYGLLDELDVDGRTALSLAVAEGHSETALRLLSCGAKFDIPDNQGWTTLHLAIRKNLPEVVRAILADGAGLVVNAQDSRGNTPLHEAIFRGYVGLSRNILDCGADPKLQNADGKSPLHAAVKSGIVQLAILLVETAGVSLDTQDFKLQTPLHHAAKLGRVIIARQLLDRGANVNAKDDRELTPLHLAASACNTEMIKLLIAYRGSLSFADNVGDTPILRAASHGQLDSYETLLQLGAGETTLSASRSCVLHRAAMGGNVKMVQKLLDRGWNVNITNKRMETPAHYAAKYGHKDILTLLLDHEDYEATVDEEGFGPEHFAAFEGHADCVEVFLDRGLTNLFQPHDLWTPLHCAVIFGRLRVIKTILRRLPGSLGCCTNQGISPMVLATCGGCISAMKTLMEHGADISVLAPNGKTLLQIALEKRDLKAVKVLLKELHRRMTLSEMRPIPFSTNELRRSRSLPQIEKRSAISEDDDSDDKGSIRTV